MIKLNSIPGYIPITFSLVWVCHVIYIAFLLILCPWTSNISIIREPKSLPRTYRIRIYIFTDSQVIPMTLKGDKHDLELLNHRPEGPMHHLPQPSITSIKNVDRTQASVVKSILPSPSTVKSLALQFLITMTLASITANVKYK